MIHMHCFLQFAKSNLCLLGSVDASIHRIAESTDSRNPVYSFANRYASRAGQWAVARPNRRGGQHNMYEVG